MIFQNKIIIVFYYDVNTISSQFMQLIFIYQG